MLCVGVHPGVNSLNIYAFTTELHKRQVLSIGEECFMMSQFPISCIKDLWLEHSYMYWTNLLLSLITC